VAGQVTPVSQRAQKAETRNGEQDKQLEVLETDSSKTKEAIADVRQNINGLDTRLKSTTETAQTASSAATQAQQQAQDAGQKATEARTYAGNRADTLEKTIENYDKFKLARTVNVLFDSGRSELGQEGKNTLDELAQQAGQMRRLVLEIQGFTDNTGPQNLNLSLSQARAEAVVRYLTSKNVPLRNIHLIGVGSAAPVADNKTRTGRRQNRRVEVRVFTPEADVSSASTTGTAAAQLR